MTKKPSFQPCSEKQRLILQDDQTDILLVGGGVGGGKSFMALVKALKYCQDPAARVLIVRLTYPMLKAIGGLVDEAKNIYPAWKAEWKSQAMEWHFPNGAQIKFVAMPTDLSEVQGWQATNIIVDEGAEFKLSDILAMNARLRGARYKGKLNMLISCNPSRHSWLYDWLSPYCLDATTGIPIAGTEHITRWFVILGGIIYWGNSKEELYQNHGKGFKQGVDFIPMSFRFIPMDIYSNPVLLKNNPSYLANILAQSKVAQARYLHGSWTAVPEGNSYFQRKWIEIIPCAPEKMERIRSWDIAATIPSEVNRDPDYTCGVMLGRTYDGTYIIEHVIRDRRLTDGVLRLIVETAVDDGLDIPVTIPRDPSAGGKIANSYFTKVLAEQGLYVRSVAMSGHSSKIQRFLPFCTLAEGGNVKIVDGPWVEDLLAEMENFDGTRGRHDDQVDALSDAFNTLCRRVEIPSFTLPNLTQNSPIPSIS